MEIRTKPATLVTVDQGSKVDRWEVPYNEFVIVGTGNIQVESIGPVEGNRCQIVLSGFEADQILIGPKELEPIATNQK